MEEWRRDGRKEVVMVDMEALVPKDHLLRKIEKVMNYEWLYDRLAPYYCHDNGRPGADPVVLIKMVLIQHLFGIPSLRQIYQRIRDTLSYRWFLGYGLLDEIPHFATVSYGFTFLHNLLPVPEIHRAGQTAERANTDQRRIEPLLRDAEQHPRKQHQNARRSQ